MDQQIRTTTTNLMASIKITTTITTMDYQQLCKTLWLYQPNDQINYHEHNDSQFLQLILIFYHL